MLSTGVVCMVLFAKAFTAVVSPGGAKVHWRGEDSRAGGEELCHATGVPTRCGGEAVQRRGHLVEDAKIYFEAVLFRHCGALDDADDVREGFGGPVQTFRRGRDLYRCCVK